MEAEDLVALPSSNNSSHGNENDYPLESSSDTIKPDSHDNAEALVMIDSKVKVNAETSAFPVGFELKESVLAVEKLVSTSSLPAENISVASESEISLSSNEKDVGLLTETDIKATSSAGVMRLVDVEQTAVHVTYKSLPRESKQKLEQLLQQWSRWHSQSCSSSYDSSVMLESGEETYFPALCVGSDKPLPVSFWVENQTKIQSNKEFTPLDSTSVPLYDRGYSLVLASADGSSSLNGVEKLESRCFNCGSYTHALKDCRRRRDNAAVNSARKLHKSRRNQNASSISNRYYQSSRGGKYDGLTPGVLDPETMELLGLREFDPPPWLNRMRELGYPPGYLDSDEESQPSGITIFGEDNLEEREEGEILDASVSEPSKKMSVKFPGVNAPIPENADERLWAPSVPSSPPRQHGYQSLWKHNNSSENQSKWQHYTEQQRWYRDMEDDGPPGCGPETSPSLANHFPKVRENQSGKNSDIAQGGASTPWSPSYSRSFFTHR